MPRKRCHAATKKGHRCTNGVHSGYTLKCMVYPDDHNHYFCAKHFMKNSTVVHASVCKAPKPVQLSLFDKAKPKPNPATLLKIKSLRESLRR